MSEAEAYWKATIKSYKRRLKDNEYMMERFGIRTDIGLSDVIKHMEDFGSYHAYTEFLVANAKRNKLMSKTND